MMLPPNLPVNGPYAKLYQHINAIAEVVRSQQPAISLGTKTAQSSVGVLREADSKTKQSSEGSTDTTPYWG